MDHVPIAGRGRTYTLSTKVYRHSGGKAAYIRQAGFDPIQQAQMVMNYFDSKQLTLRRYLLQDLNVHLIERLR